MKICNLSIVLSLLSLFAPHCTARLIQVLPYQHLFDKSDWVVIATPIDKTSDTKETNFLPGITTQNADGTTSRVLAVGVETHFRVCVVLKGDKAIQQFVLHHYRETSFQTEINGPALVFFDPADLMQRSSYLLFLTREPDGRYAPTGGQTDPGHKAITRVPLEMK